MSDDENANRYSSPGGVAARFVSQKLVMKPYIWSVLHVHEHGRRNLDMLKPPFIAVANHSSHMDAPLVMCSLPRRLSKKQIVRITKERWRTERVYEGISGALSEEEFYGHDASAGPGWSAIRGRAGVQSFALIDRLKRYYGCGVWAGKLFCLCVIVDYLLFVLLELWQPRDSIDRARDWPKKIKDVGVGEEEEEISRKRSTRHRERREH